MSIRNSVASTVGWLLRFVLVILLLSPGHVRQASAAGASAQSFELWSPNISGPTVCRPGEGWHWTRGPATPKVAAKAATALLESGVDAAVEATSYGETDSCGQFLEQGIDFILTVESTIGMDSAERRRLAEIAVPVLTPLARPNLGTVRVRSSVAGALLASEELVTIDPSGGPLLQQSPNVASQKMAFVMLSGNNSLSILDTTNNTIAVSNIPVGGSPEKAIFSPDGLRVYVLNGNGNSISIIDSATYQLIATVAVGSNPRGLAVSVDGRRVYVANNASQSLSIIDTATMTVTKTIGLSAHPEDVAVSPDGRRVFIAATVPFVGFILDAGTESLIGSFSASAGNGIAITPDGARAYITNWAGTVSVVNLTTFEVIKNITVGSFPHRVRLSPDGQRAYVSNYSSNDVSVIDTALNTVIGTIPVGGTPWMMDVLGDGSRVYVPTSAGKVAVIDAGALTVTLQVTTGSSPHGVALYQRNTGAVSKKVYVIAYNPTLANGDSLSTRLGWQAHATLTQGTVDFFRSASGNRVWYDVVATTVVTDGWPIKVDGYQYTEASYLAMIAGTQPAHTPDGVDYNALVNNPRFDICGKANRGEIDEVWIYNGPGFGFYESTLVGPGAYWYNSPPVPGVTSCSRLIPIMGPSQERGQAEAVHNFGHRTESTMSQVYGGWSQNNVSHNWERYALVKALSPSFAYSGCGNIHFPPNGTSDYDYANASNIPTNCDDFANYPSLRDPIVVSKSVTCATWSCTQLSFLRYWFAHLPSSYGCGPDNVSNTWWEYFETPSRALAPSAQCQPQQPQARFNFGIGQSGSFFTLSGSGFSPHGSVNATINGRVQASTDVDSAGRFQFVVATAGADSGDYVAVVTTNPILLAGARSFQSESSAGAVFTLSPSAPLRPRIDTAVLITVTAGIGFGHNAFVPGLLR